MFFLGTDKLNEDDIKKYTLQKENFSTFELSLILNQNKYLSIIQISNIINEIENLDDFKLKLEVKCDESARDNIDDYTISTKSLTPNDEVAIQNLFNMMENGDFLKISINIQKKSVPIRLYCYSFFIDTLKNLKLSEFLKYLSREFKDKEKKSIITNEENIKFNCRMFEISHTITSLYNNINHISSFERDEILKCSNTYTSKNNLYEYDFLPSDFYNTIENGDSDLEELFTKLRLFLSMCFMSNISKIDTNNLDQFEISILQQRSLILNNTFHDLKSKDASDLYKIYKWVYEEKFTPEKLYHARAIISKDFECSTNIWKLPENSLASCQTAHSIYLKENVEKYLETKGRVAELIAELTVKNRESIIYITNSFKNNNAAILTYFISLFIFNSLSSGKFEIFNKSNFILSLLFFAISSALLWMTIKQTNIDISASKDHYKSVKDIYSDIFEPVELDLMFKSEYYQDSINSVKNSLYIHKWFWICELIAMAITVSLITFWEELGDVFTFLMGSFKY